MSQNLKYRIANDDIIYFDETFDEPLVKYITIMRNHSGVYFMKNKGTNYKHPIVLTKNLRNLHLAGIKFKKLKLPKNLINLTLFYDGHICLQLTKKVRILWFNSIGNEQIILTKNINVVKFGHNLNVPIFLTKNLSKMTFGKNFNQPITLPKKIICLIFSECFNQPLKLSPNLKKLTLGRDFCQNIVFEKMINHFTIDIHIVISTHFKLFSHLPNSSNTTKIECFLRNVAGTMTRSGHYIDHYVIRDEFINDIKSNVPHSTNFHYWKYTPELPFF